MSGELYSDYMQREPHPRNAVFIKRWHGKLLALALKGVDKAPISVLEIGPGHGYFAEHCRQAGMAYEFCDTSPAVVSKMNELGFHGHLGLVQEAAANLGKYDMIWMSHMSASYLMMSDCRKSLRSIIAMVHVTPLFNSFLRCCRKFHIVLLIEYSLHLGQELMMACCIHGKRFSDGDRY